MANDLYLRLGGTAATYFVQVFASWLTCVAITRLSRSPRFRFFVWQAFVCGAAAYWVVCARSVWNSRNAIGYSTATSARGRTLYGILLPHAWIRGAALVIQFLAILYATVVILLLLRLLKKHINLHAALWHGRKATDEIEGVFGEISQLAGVHNARLSILPGIAAPATVGIFRPRILLPELFEADANFELLHDVVAHELAHVARWDYAWATFADLAQCFLFFHPSIAAARKELVVQRELACDQVVVGDQPEHRADYAQCLTTFARLQMLAEYAPLGIDFAGGASFLGMRVRAILAGPARPSLPSRLVRATTATTVMTAFALLCPLLVVWVSAAPDSTVTRLRTPRPVALLNHAARVHRAHLAHQTPLRLIAAEHEERNERTAQSRPVIFPPDGALSDDTFSDSSVSLATDDEPADLSNTAGLGRPPGTMPFPSSTVRAAVTRDVVDNLGRILTRPDRDEPTRPHVRR